MSRQRWVNFQIWRDGNSDAAVTSAKFKVVGDHLAVVAQPPATVDGGAGVPFTVELLDAKNERDKNATTSATVSLNVVTPGNNPTLAGTVAAAFVGGIARFTAAAGPTVDAAGTYTFTVAEANKELSTGGYISTNTSTSVDTAPFKVRGAHLAILGKPPTTDVGQPVTLTVAYENARNRIETTQNGAGVLLSLAPAADANAGSVAAVLGGTITANFVHGVAKFTLNAGPTVSLPGDYTLTATDPSAPAVAADMSAPFTIAGYHLVAQKQVKNVDIDASIPLTFALLDSKNRLVTKENSATVSLTYQALEGGVNAIETGTLVKALTGGVAVFAAGSAPSFDTAGTYQFVATETGAASVGATASTRPVKTVPVKVNGDHITFLTAPANGSVGDPFAVTPAIVSPSGVRNLKVNTGTIGLTLTPVEGGAGATLTNTTANFAPLPVAYGAAQFKNLLVTSPGTFTITATQYDASGQPSKDSVPRVSKPFKVAGLHVAVLTQPADAVDPYETIPHRFAMENAKGKIDTQANGYSVAYTLTATRGGAGASTVNGIDNYAFTDGVADLTTTGLVSVTDNPGTFVFDVTATGSAPNAAAVEPAKTHPFKVRPLHLVVQNQPSDTPVFAAIGAKIALVDSAGRVDTYDNNNTVDLTVTGTGGGKLVNAANRKFDAGVADLSGPGGVGIDTPGTYGLTVGVAGGTALPATDSVPTDPFKITPLALSFTTQPASAAANTPVPISLNLVDASGSPVTSLATSLNVVLTLQPVGTATGVLTGNPAPTFTLQGILLTPPSFGVTTPGTYKLVATLTDPTGTPIGSPATSNPFTIG